MSEEPVIDKLVEYLEHDLSILDDKSIKIGLDDIRDLLSNIIVLLIEIFKGKQTLDEKVIEKFKKENLSLYS